MVAKQSRVETKGHPYLEKSNEPTALHDSPLSLQLCHPR